MRLPQIEVRRAASAGGSASNVARSAVTSVSRVTEVGIGTCLVPFPRSAGTVDGEVVGTGAAVREFLRGRPRSRAESGGVEGSCTPFVVRSACTADAATHLWRLDRLAVVGMLSGER
jgi:hypothetical protein